MSVNLTNPPIDRRRLSDEDKALYDRSGMHASAQKALARTRAYRGQQKYERNRPPNTQTRTPRNEFFGDIAIQQQRMRELGMDNRRAESFVPD